MAIAITPPEEPRIGTHENGDRIIMGIHVSSELDLDFVLQLSMLGYVKLHSSQVTVMSEEGAINFEKLIIPRNCRVQWVSSDICGNGPHRSKVSITFKFGKE